jgi:hypothetical protein
MMTTPLIALSYISRSLIAAHGVEMHALAKQCAGKNLALGISGALYFDGIRFLQTLEGAADTVNALYETIRADPRHEDVALLQREPVASRRFGAWGMKMIDGTAFAHLRNHFDRGRLIGAPPAILERRLSLLQKL